MDHLFTSAPSHGATFIVARFPRAFVDVNREPWELDPKMFDGALPPWVKTQTPRISAGLGAVPRIVGEGTEIYDAPLPAAEASQRMEEYFLPYHEALDQAIQTHRNQFGTAIFIDCHSMPSRTAQGRPNTNVDIVLGDRYAAACAPAITEAAEHCFKAMGLTVARNSPYAGGYCTERHGRPKQGVHALQIEINRALYLDEKTIEPNANFTNMKNIADRFITTMTAFATQFVRETD